MSATPPTLPTPPTAPQAPAGTPLSAPLGGLILAAAGTALQAVVPYATGGRINWALLAATFLVVFGGALILALYHVQLPSATQQALIGSLTSLLTPLLTHIQTPAQPPTVIVHPAPTPTPPPVIVPAAVSTDVPTA